MASLYDLKPRFQALLRPLSRGLLGAGVTPNAVTLAALALSAAMGAALALWPASAWALAAVPLVAPLGVAFEVNPVHLGVIFLANLELGFLCPPMGLNLFLSATRFQKPLPHLYRHALPFLLIMTFGVLFITYIPSASLWLLRMLGKA